MTSRRIRTWCITDSRIERVSHASIGTLERKRLITRSNCDCEGTVVGDRVVGQRGIVSEQTSLVGSTTQGQRAVRHHQRRVSNVVSVAQITTVEADRRVSAT